MRPYTRTLLLASLGAATVASPEVIERVVATVNGDIITQTEFEARQIDALRAAGVSSADVPRFLQENNARLLQDAVDDLLLFQKGRELGFRLPAGYLDQAVDNIKQQQKIANDGQFEELLRREGMTIDGLKRNIERSLMRRQVISTEIGTGVTVTEPEAREEYQRLIAERYTKPETVRLQSIFVSSDSDGAADRAAAAQRRVAAGEDFSALAREYSDSPTAASGGDLGTLVVAEMNPEIAALAAGLEPGEVSATRQTPAGYQILRVVERTPASVIPFEDVKDELTDEIVQRRQGERFENYIAELRDAASVRTLVREVGLNVDVPVERSILIDDSEFTTEEPPPVAIDAAGEFAVSGSSGPRRVTPGASDAVPEPAPTPTPDPEHR